MSIIKKITDLIFGKEPKTSNPIDPDVARKLIEFELSQRRLEEKQYRCKTLMEEPEED